MWSSQRRPRAPVLPDHALCAIVIVSGSRIAGRPVVALIVASAFFRPRYCNLGCVQLLDVVRRRRPEFYLQIRRAVARLEGALYHLQRISRKSPSRCNPGSKPRIALAARHPPTLPAAVGSLMEIPDAQCHPFRHRRADGGRPDPAGGGAPRRRLAPPARAIPRPGADTPAPTP